MINANQLNGILKDVMPALKNDSKFWIAFPKRASKIVTDLNKERSFSELTDAGYEEVNQVDLDHVWNACCFELPGKNLNKKSSKSISLQEA